MNGWKVPSLPERQKIALCAYLHPLPPPPPANCCVLKLLGGWGGREVGCPVDVHAVTACVFCPPSGCRSVPDYVTGEGGEHRTASS